MSEFSFLHHTGYSSGGMYKRAPVLVAELMEIYDPMPLTTIHLNLTWPVCHAEELIYWHKGLVLQM